MINSCKLLAVAAAAASLFWTAGAAEMRTWTATEGGYQARAEMVELTADDVVVLRRLDGRRIRVPLSRLSDADQKYARSQTELQSRSPIEWVTAAQVEAEAVQCKTAKTALLVYQSFLNGDRLNSTERALVEKKLPEWKNLAERNFVRLGRQWLAKSEADKHRAEAEDLVTHAIELLRLKSDEAAKQILDKATKLDPDSPKAEFLMGFVYGLIANNDERAVMHFENALRREPGNVSTLNNMAVSEYLLKRYAQAVGHWAEAASLSPQNKVIVDNLATVLEIQGLRSKKLPQLPPNQLDRLSETYRNMLNQKGMTPPKTDEKIVFWYMSPYGREWAVVDGTADTTNPESGESVITGGGTGFVVADGYVLTNAHVVEGAETLLVMNPESKEDDPLPATVVASNPEVDLAILHCEKLKAPPLALANALPRRGSDIMVLGYPKMFTLGYHLKSTRGSVTALPDDATNSMLLLDAVANPGNSGGPICDQCGCVVAVLTAGYTFQTTYTAGVPTTVALPFLAKHIPDFKPVTAGSETLSWPDVDAKVSPSTVLILRKQNSVTDAGFAGRGKSRGVDDKEKDKDY
jgi:S1-C subfamily serine protease